MCGLMFVITVTSSHIAVQKYLSLPIKSGPGRGCEVELWRGDLCCHDILYEKKGDLRSRFKFLDSLGRHMWV
ncbi:UNVERIFIED_CONTAM: hypothetical protein FKN15_070789 [Acipenser sinensis]